jgi:hypothetical protein
VALILDFFFVFPSTGTVAFTAYAAVGCYKIASADRVDLGLLAAGHSLSDFDLFYCTEMVYLLNWVTKIMVGFMIHDMLVNSWLLALLLVFPLYFLLFLHWNMDGIEGKLKCF